MTRRTFGLLAYTVAAFSLSSDTPARAQVLSSAIPSHRVAGFVVDAGTGAAMAGVRVLLTGLQRATTTGPDGGFTFEAVPEGEHVLRAMLDGFEPSLPQRITVTASPRVIEITYRLALSAHVRPPALEPRGPRSLVSRTIAGGRVESMPGALGDVFRALQSSPGVAATQDNRNDLLIRGGGAIETLMRVDGFDVPNPNHFASQGGSGGGVGLIPPSLIERVELQPGGFSVAFGERASGVVDIRLRSGGATPHAAAVSVGVDGVTGVVDGSLGPAGTWLISGRRSLLEHLGEGGARAVPRYADALTKLELQPTPRHFVRVLALGGRDAVASSSRSHANRLRADQRVALIGGSVASTWRERLTSSLVLSLGSNRIDGSVYDSGEVAGVDRSSEVESRMRAEVHHWDGSSEVLAGAALKHTRLDFDLQADAYENLFSETVDAVRLKSRDTFTDTAVYTELTRSYARLRGTAGMRLDRWGTIGRVFGSPRAQAEYALTPSARVTGSWGKYRQTIPYIWLGSNPENRDLGPISSKQATVGLEVTTGRSTSLTVEAFDKRYRHYPVDPAAPGRVLVSAVADFESPLVGVLRDGGLVRAHGVDAALGSRVTQRLDVSAGLSFWQVRQRGLDGAWRRADHDVRAQARLEAQYRGGASWSAAARFRYATGRPHTPFDVGASALAREARYDLSRINVLVLPAYQRLDLRVDRRFTIGHTAVIVYAELINTLGHDNVHAYEWNRGAHSSRAVRQWGRLPLGGARLEF